ncbi:Crp/Fnr family transcriptional regulator [Candidatus Sulfurimonas baltica]|uniref:Crp/Fnr family transcriptional regulator n=1 Tax=Candidatus Sulfurimonas baltica TaxID=2740404 RepID=A0A7S7LW94_9BACT|nr:Crp/Fnr family transcriptional regulator [Candidatus Sulfurimonas baltica]QOY52565.1 Crp/Fnr family transcriptional regulator [Candidatus Sulfurimonas baltica]
MQLQDFDFYDELTSDEQELLLKTLKPVSMDAGKILFYQGDITQDILLLEDGEVRVYMQGSGMNEITLYSLRQNEQCIVNTTSTINQIPTIGSAITTTPIRGYLLNKELVVKLMRDNSNYQSYIFSLLTLRLDSVARVLENIKFKHLDERIYEWLQAQKNPTIQITHEELANYMGSSRVVVSRILKKMERESLLKLSRGSIELIHNF